MFFSQYNMFIFSLTQYSLKSMSSVYVFSLCLQSYVFSLCLQSIGLVPAVTSSPTRQTGCGLEGGPMTHPPYPPRPIWYSPLLALGTVLPLGECSLGAVVKNPEGQCVFQSVSVESIDISTYSSVHRQVSMCVPKCEC